MAVRPADGIAFLIAAAAIVLSIGRALPGGGAEFYSLATTAVGAAMLVIGGWWLRRQAPGTPFREMAIPAAVATVVPLLVGSSLSTFDLAVDVVPWALAAAAAGTVGLTLADSLPDPYRLRMGLLTAGLAVAAGLLGTLALGRSLGAPGVAGPVVGVVLLAATTLAPGLVAAVVRHMLPTARQSRDSILTALELAVIGITPAIAVVTTWRASDPREAAPLIIWILVVLAAQAFAVRPLARTATVATAQRDQVVAAMEAERSRIAADIHDDALQELTMLGWRLDSSGDKEGAATAREVADRLRAILGDLRLPILDDLGTGFALEWLVERVGRLAGGEVRLERADRVRPPADVELAFFRVAQEALSNAVRHGKPPIVVRYWTSPSGATLSIDDSGAGISTTEDASAATGHFGLMNMRQRAEQIGGLLDVRRWPTGGTRVTLEWRA